MDGVMTVDERRVRNGFCGCLGYFPFERGWDGIVLLNIIIRLGFKSTEPFLFARQSNLIIL